MTPRDAVGTSRQFIENLETRLFLSAFPPTAVPTDLTAEALSSRSVKLHWTDNSSNEWSFWIYRSDDAGATWQQTIRTTPNATTWYDQTVMESTDYMYRMKAHTLTRDSALSDPADVTTPASADDAFAVLDDITGELKVLGTPSHDVIDVQLVGSDIVVTLNGSDLSFAQADITAISVLALQGNDKITIGDGVGDTYVSGGSGKDTILGGDGNDRLDGGSGDDTVRGGDGDDVIAGGGGKDRLYGDAGQDYLDGGAANDILFGGDGNDYLFGGDGSDRLFGQGGDEDTMVGGGGRDTLEQN